MFFDDVQKGVPDAMYHLKVQADGDSHPKKVDLGVGVYRNEQGAFHELRAVTKAKQHLAVTNPNHDYEVTVGNARFLSQAARLVFGGNSEAMSANKIVSVQTISGTGSIHIGLMFLSRSVSRLNKTVYLGTPAWGNYEPMCRLVGLDVKTYQHYQPDTGAVSWDSVMEAVRGAAAGSIFILQACCHNPTAANFSKGQWQVLAKEMKARKLFPLFDIAYQGLGAGLDEDVYCVRLFESLNIEMLVCQSFSKNFGLYGERVGALHAYCSHAEVAPAVQDQLRFLIRSEFSSSPAFGARVVTTILSDIEQEEIWREELDTLRTRLVEIREKLADLLTNRYKTPGNWEIITQGGGLFTMLPLTSQQCAVLQKDYHIYLVPNGRITIPGINSGNVEYVAKSIDSVVRGA